MTKKFKFLFVHQNFPGQFKNLAPFLAAQGHTVKALHLGRERRLIDNIDYVPYATQRTSTKGMHPWVIDFETKVIRAEACFRAARALKEELFSPDIIIAHHGWGESLFLNEVWPAARLGIYCEFYYRPEGADVNFDPEFKIDDPSDVCRLRLKNLTNVLHFDLAVMGIAPTAWQASVFPETFRRKISVIHDGVNTKQVVPNPTASVRLPSGKRLDRKSKVVTFVARNLEPYRGYHSFMRAVPQILQLQQDAEIVIVGGDSVGYGQSAPNGKTWKQLFIEEVRSQIDDSAWSRVHFLGQIQYAGLIALFQITKAHVYLTYPFVLSWSMLEAMSCGAPVIGSKTAPVMEVLIHKENGLLVDFFSPKEIADAVVNLLDDENLRVCLGNTARNTIVRNYDLDSVCLPKQIRWVDAVIESPQA